MAKVKLKKVVVLELNNMIISDLEDELNKFYELGYRVVCSCGNSNDILILQKKW